MEPAAHVPLAGPSHACAKTKRAGWRRHATRAAFQSIPVSAINLYLDRCCWGAGGAAAGRGCRFGDVNKTGQPDTLYISAASKCQDEVALAATWQISYPSSAARSVAPVSLACQCAEAA